MCSTVGGGLVGCRGWWGVREGKGREGKGREGKGREGKGVRKTATMPCDK